MAKPREKPRTTDERRWTTHPLYGKVPMIWRSGTHAVRADVRRQIHCAPYDVPKYFYVDETRRCIQCDDRFTFKASEQQYWYETRGFHFNSVPVRCTTCRRQRRDEHALGEQIARARQAVAEGRTDPGAHLALARAIVEYHEKTGQGRLDEAVPSARRAAKLSPQAHEALLWEGIAHARAGRAGSLRSKPRERQTEKHRVGARVRVG